MPTAEANRTTTPTTTSNRSRFQQLELTFWAPRDATEKPRRKLWYEFLLALNLRGASLIAVAFVLDANADSKGRTTISITRVATDTGISRSTIERAIRRMDRLGALWIEPRYDSRNGRRTTSRIHLNQGWKRHPRSYRRNVSAGHSPRHCDGGPPVTVTGLEVSTVKEVRVLSAAAVEDTPSRATPPTLHEQQQPYRQIRRIEGLIGTIASRARQLGIPYDEADERHGIADGDITVDDLQRHADDLAEAIKDRQLRRAHGPRYREDPKDPEDRR